MKRGRLDVTYALLEAALELPIGYEIVNVQIPQDSYGEIGLIIEGPCMPKVEKGRPYPRVKLTGGSAYFEDPDTGEVLK